MLNKLITEMTLQRRNILLEAPSFVTGPGTMER